MRQESHGNVSSIYLELQKNLEVGRGNIGIMTENLPEYMNNLNLKT